MVDQHFLNTDFKKGVKRTFALQIETQNVRFILLRKTAFNFSATIEEHIFYSLLRITLYVKVHQIQKRHEENILRDNQYGPCLNHLHLQKTINVDQGWKIFYFSYLSDKRLSIPGDHLIVQYSCRLRSAHCCLHISRSGDKKGPSSIETKAVLWANKIACFPSMKF